MIIANSRNDVINLLITPSSTLLASSADLTGRITALLIANGVLLLYKFHESTKSFFLLGISSHVSFLKIF